MKSIGKSLLPLLFLAYAIYQIATLPAYGFTWDFHFHFFGGGKLLGIEPTILEPRNLPYVEPDPRRAWTLPYGPLMSIPPVLSYLLFHTTLRLLPPDVSYHIPIVLWGIAGIAILYGFVRDVAGSHAAIAASVILALTPRYIGDMHNNMKDIPSAVVFAANMWLLWKFSRKRTVATLLLAVLGFAVAFNVKINSIFIPVVFGIWVLWQTIREKHPVTRLFYTLPYAILAPVAAFLLWAVFWQDPVGQLLHAVSTFGIGTNNIEVLLNGTWYCSGSTVPWYYPYWYLAITTPIPALLLFVAGLFAKPKKSLFVFWLVVPLSRYFIPSVGVIDGIRHFEEVLFPIAAIAAFGWDWIRSRIPNQSVKTIVTIAVLLCLVVPVIAYHPYEIAYFNGLVGGAKGAVGRYDLDYWGTSQKAAVEWVNLHAPRNAHVHIVMAAAVAGQYLRPDLLATLNTKGYDESDFVILLNRQSFLYRFYYAYEYFLHHTPAHTVSVSGAPLTWVYDNRTPNTTSRQTPFWTGEDPCIRKYWKGEQ